jgi:hypothetical protein
VNVNVTKRLKNVGVKIASAGAYHSHQGVWRAQRRCELEISAQKSLSIWMQNENKQRGGHEPQGTQYCAQVGRRASFSSDSRKVGVITFIFVIFFGGKIRKTKLPQSLRRKKMLRPVLDTHTNTQCSRC